MRAKRLAWLRASLRGQLLLWLIPPVLAVVVVSALLSNAIALRFANDAYDISLLDSAKSLAEQLRFDDGGPRLALPQAAEEIIRYDPYDRIYYRVLAASGETIAGRGDLPAPQEPPRSDGPPEEPAFYYDGAVGGTPVRICAFAVHDGAGRTVATVLVGETLVKRARLARSLLLADLIAPLVVLPLMMAVIVWFGIGRGLGPLKDLANALARRGAADLREIGDSRTPAEVRPLTRAIDDLMRRLAAAQDAQRRFIEDAAHQLRTPLAGLAAQAERALRARDAEATRQALQRVNESSWRLTRLANQLLTLAAAEPGHEPKRDFAAVDLAKLVRQVCAEWVPEALRRQIDLGLEAGEAPEMIQGDELLLTELLNNLLDNALRYGAPPGGRVTVRLGGCPLVLGVEDNGAGIPAAERERIFERFHRIPGSASGGSGLGLAIVRQIALAHGAAVEVRAGSEGRGTLVTVAFAGTAAEPAPLAA
jgi:two-component system sensor histidine kinase TctE